MIIKHEDRSFVAMIDGVKRKTLAVGEKGLLGEFTLAEGSVLPAHSHPHEQIGYLVTGELLFTIGENEFLAKPGDSWAIPGNVRHAVKVLQPSVAVEVFVPLREDYLP